MVRNAFTPLRTREATAYFAEGIHMPISVRAGPINRVAVIVLALATFVLGVAYTALGGQLIRDGATWAERARGDPWGPVAAFFGLGPALLVAVGAAFLSLGIL